MTSQICWRSKRRSPGGRTLPGFRRIRLLAILIGIVVAPVSAHERHDHEGSGTLLDKAMAAQAHHDFATALERTKEALTATPDDDHAWLLRASLHLIRGEIDEAAGSCRALRRSSPLVVVTCHANVARAAGNADLIRHKLGSLIEISSTHRIEPEALAWSLSVAGDLAVAANQPDRAAQYFRRSLEIVDNPQVRASLLDVLIDENKLSEAQRLLNTGESSLTLIMQDLIIRKRQGDNVVPDIARFDRKFRHWIGHGDYEHAREMARFYLDVADDPERAHALAQINAGLQQEPEDHLLLQRAALAVMKHPDAATY